MLGIAFSELALEETGLHGSGNHLFLLLCATERAWPSPELPSSQASKFRPDSCSSVFHHPEKTSQAVS